MVYYNWLIRYMMYLFYQIKLGKVVLYGLY